jgi:hypothetical protein
MVFSISARFTRLDTSYNFDWALGGCYVLCLGDVIFSYLGLRNDNKLSLTSVPHWKKYIHISERGAFPAYSSTAADFM